MLKEQDYLIRESHVGSFMRRVTLPEGVDSEKIHAKYANGVLEISMPIHITETGRKIMIEGGETKVGMLR